VISCPGLSGDIQVKWVIGVLRFGCRFSRTGRLRSAMTRMIVLKPNRQVIYLDVSEVDIELTKIFVGVQGEGGQKMN